jgi:hypothetical protein
MNKQIKLDGFQNVANMGIAICDMNNLLGSVLEKITLTLGGTFTKAMITKIDLQANGKTIWETDGTKLEAANKYLVGAAAATILKLDFMDRKARTVNAWQAGAFDLSRESGITSLRLYVTIAGATSPTLAGVADVSPPTNAKDEEAIRWLITRKHRATYTVGAAGEFALPIPHIDPAGGGSNYRRIYFYSANMTALRTMREGVVEHELTVAQNKALQLDNGRVDVTADNLVVFDPVQDGQLMGRTWDTRPSSNVRSAQFYGTFSAGETITIETEELLPFGAY